MRRPALSAAELAERLGGRLRGSGDRLVRGVASPERATAQDLVFATSPAALAAALAGRGGTLLLREADALPADRTAILVSDPKLAFARAATWLIPPRVPSPGVHPSASVDATATVPPSTAIGPGAVVGPGVSLGEGCVIGAHAVIGEGSALGPGCSLHPHVVLYPGVRLGARCVLHAGAVIGAPGFGFVASPEGPVRFPQLGTVVLGDDVEVGVHCAIDRGALEDTTIGARTKLDNLVHVGHGATVGSDCVIAGQSGVAGSASLGDRVQVAGQVGIDQGAAVGDGVQLGSRTWVLPRQVVEDGAWVGAPAAPAAEGRRRLVASRRLPDLVREVRGLRRRLESLEGQVAGEEAADPEP